MKTSQRKYAMGQCAASSNKKESIIWQSMDRIRESEKSKASEDCYAPASRKEAKCSHHSTCSLLMPTLPTISILT